MQVICPGRATSPVLCARPRAGRRRELLSASALTREAGLPPPSEEPRARGTPGSERTHGPRCLAASRHAESELPQVRQDTLASRARVFCVSSVLPPVGLPFRRSFFWGAPIHRCGASSESLNCPSLLALGMGLAPVACGDTRRDSAALTAGEGVRAASPAPLASHPHPAPRHVRRKRPSASGRDAPIVHSPRLQSSHQE